MQMRPEAWPIEFTNGRAHHYEKKKWIGQRYLNAYIFYEVANSYEFIGPHSYDLVRFV